MKLPTSLFSTKGDAEHICDLDHPYDLSNVKSSQALHKDHLEPNGVFAFTEGAVSEWGLT